MKMKMEEREKILDSLKEKYPIEEEVSFNEFNINEKLQENANKLTKYRELYEHHKFIYEELKEKYEELKGKRYDHFRFESDRNLTKTEIEQYYLPKDSKLKKMNELLKKQEIKVNFFKLCIDSLNNLYWRIKSYIDNERI